MAAVLFVTRSKTSHTTPEVVSARKNSPARAARFALVTSQGRWPCRNSTRWNATGAVISPVATTEPVRIARNAPFWTESRSLNRSLNGRVSRNPVRIWMPVWVTRSSWSSSLRLRVSFSDSSSSFSTMGARVVRHDNGT